MDMKMEIGQLKQSKNLREIALVWRKLSIFGFRIGFKEEQI